MALDGITYRNHATPDGTKWGNTGKLSDLTAEEIDNNFWELYSRLKDLEDNPPQATSISNIIVNGSQLSFQLSDGSSFGPYTLPIATFQLRGDIVDGDTYYELDIVTVPHDGVYLVRLEHEAELPFDPDAQISGQDIYLKIFGFDAELYDIAFSFPGKVGIGIDDGAAMCSHTPSRPILLRELLADSVAKLNTAPAAAMEIIIKKDATTIGSIDFGIGGTLGDFTFDDDVSFNGTTETLRLIKPTGGIDTTARELTVTIRGEQVFD